MSLTIGEFTMTRLNGHFEDHSLISSFNGYQHFALIRLVSSNLTFITNFSACVAIVWPIAFRGWLTSRGWRMRVHDCMEDVGARTAWRRWVHSGSWRMHGV